MSKKNNTTTDSETLYLKLKKEADEQAKQKVEANKKPKGKLVHLIALTNLSGAYNLPYSQGQDFKIHEKQAKELLDLKDAEVFKVKK